MHGFFIYISNHLEKLAKKLAEIVAVPMDFPLSPEIILVHSKGMERWISLELARHNGICANTIYPFPNAWLKTVFELVDPDLPENTAFDPDPMIFKIMGLLPACAGGAGFEEIRRYLADDEDDVKRYQLSQKIAETFDQYLTFRPEMIFDWEKGEDKQWQAQLWRSFIKGSEHLHRAGLRKAFLKKLTSKAIPPDMLPQRLSVFGTSYMPLFHLEVLSALSKYVEVNLFVMNPCREYWSDIVTDKEIQKIKRQYGEADFSEQDLFLEKGNALLSSFGAMGREFFSIISGVEGDVTELFDDGCCQKHDMLSIIQSDILLLTDRTAEAVKVPDWDDGDTQTISIHSCHSPMREIEVLHNNLLSFFGKDPELRPGDVVVMMPDIESYAPFISAVFEGQADEKLKIPYSIADRSMEKNNLMMKGFMAILDLASTRFGAINVMAVLETTGVKEQFGIKASEVPVIEKWVRETRIRWGRDADHRKRLGFHGRKENTWAAGFERLLLGYAMPGYPQRLYSGILPYDNIEGGDAVVLGKFIEFVDRLFETAEALTRKRCLADWSVFLKTILFQFFADNENTGVERQILLRAFDRLASLAELSDFTSDIGLSVIQYYLKHYFTGEGHSGGFIDGGVTFCAMLPLRSIPAKIICLLGMNNDAFPRDYHPPGFDIMAKHPKQGDRIRRNDDKYLFLQALVSARKKLCISYVGQSNRDNSPIPPSVVVSDLIDYMSKSFRLDEKTIVVRHRLQPFSDEYFKAGGTLFSYSKEDYDACMSAEQRRAKGITINEFISEPLTHPEPELLSIDIGQLILFFSNPSKFLLQRRLSLYLDDELPGFEDEEPFLLAGLDRYRIEQDLVKDRYEGKNLEESYLLQQAMGRLPHGSTGKVAFSGMAAKTEQFVKKVMMHKGAQDPEKVEVDIHIHDVALTGIIGDVYPEKLLKAIYAKDGAKPLLEAWIYHLVFNIMKKNDQRSTFLLCKDASWCFTPVINGHEILQSLISLYMKGLRQPLIFFPQTSFEYAEKLCVKGKSETSALISSKTKWMGNDFAYGEKNDPYFQFCFSKINTDDILEGGDFQKNAITIFKPLMHNRQKMDDYFL